MDNPYFVFNTQAETEQALADINTAVRGLITYLFPEAIDEVGIIPRNIKNDNLAFESTVRTFSWGEPVEINDGRWILPVLENDHDPLFTDFNVEQYITVDYEIQQYNESWFEELIEN